MQDCVETALLNQPAIRARQAATAVADDQRAAAHSYFLPQVGYNLRYSALSQPLTVRTPNPISGPAADVFSDSAAFFSIARQAGPAAANAALAAPGSPPFLTAKNAALAAIPGTLNTNILGTSFLVNQISLVQPLWTGGKISNRYEQARLGVEAAALDERKTRQETIFNVTRAYWGAVLAGSLIRVADHSRATAVTVEKLAQNLIDEGDQFVAIPDLLRARALRRLIENERIAAARLEQSANSALKQAMGVPLDTSFQLADASLTVDRATIRFGEVLAEAYARRPEVAKARIGEQVAMLDRAIAKAQFAPDISFFGSYISLAGAQGFLDPNNPNLLAAGVGVDVPIFQGGRRVAQFRQAEDQIAQARHTSDLVQQLIALEVQQAVLEYEEMSAKIDNGSLAVKDADKALEGSWDRFDRIKAERMPEFFKELLDTRMLLTRAEVEYNQALYGYHLALARISYAAAANEDELARWGTPAENERTTGAAAGGR